MVNQSRGILLKFWCFVTKPRLRFILYNFARNDNCSMLARALDRR
jgi:hypothetical protein